MYDDQAKPRYTKVFAKLSSESGFRKRGRKPVGKRCEQGRSLLESYINSVKCNAELNRIMKKRSRIRFNKIPFAFSTYINNQLASYGLTFKHESGIIVMYLYVNI